MERTEEQRTERRLHYHWPVRFAEDFGRPLQQGQMLDISSTGGAFTCYTDVNCPYAGKELVAHFSVPRFDTGMIRFTRSARVCRVEDVNPFLRRVAIQFSEPLNFRPGEQAATETESRQRLKAVTI